MRIVKHIAGLIFCLAILVSITGCATPGGKSSDVVIELSTSGRITVENRSVPLSKLCEHLKSIGVKPSTQLSIEIPPNTTQNTLRTFASTLASGGYRKIIFKKPRKSSAVIKKN